MKSRCDWCTGDPLYIRYHDKEWGTPVRRDRKFYEFLILEGAQAGLNWLTILRKRDYYRKAFADYDFEKVASYQPEQVDALLKSSQIIRNRLKIESAIRNARALIQVRNEYGSFSRYIWNFVGQVPLINKWKKTGDIPARTKTSEIMSRELKKRGFVFVGPTICYAFMQATGMVNDHVTHCYRYDQINKKNSR